MGFFDKKPDTNFSDVKADSTGGVTPDRSADFSDVEGGSTSTGSAGTTYTVQSGDSLSKIAKRFYGDGNKWKIIHAANSAKIPNPDLIHPGQELIIPAKEN